MVLNTKVWKRAQEEIDRVVGNERLPTFEDRPFLPYIEGIVREANRYINLVCSTIMYSYSRLKDGIPWHRQVGFRLNAFLSLTDIMKGLSHASSTEDVYLGYRIPAGSTVIANQWAVLHDPSIFPDPFEFKPERWLDAKGDLLLDLAAPIPLKLAFGFGRRYVLPENFHSVFIIETRRICPGRFFAENTVRIWYSPDRQKQNFSFLFP